MSARSVALALWRASALYVARGVSRIIAPDASLWRRGRKVMRGV